jgi:hypothetical protein
MVRVTRGRSCAEFASGDTGCKTEPRGSARPQYIVLIWVFRGFSVTFDKVEKSLHETVNQKFHWSRSESWPSIDLTRNSCSIADSDTFEELRRPRGDYSKVLLWLANRLWSTTWTLRATLALEIPAEAKFSGAMCVIENRFK